MVRNFPSASIFFDLGGREWVCFARLETAGYQCVVVEPGNAVAINARKRGLANIVCATREDAKFRLHSLPVVGLFDVLEHISHDAAFLQALHASSGSAGGSI